MADEELDSQYDALAKLVEIEDWKKLTLAEIKEYVINLFEND